PLVNTASIRLTYSPSQRVETRVPPASLRTEVPRAHASRPGEGLLSRACAGDAEAFRVIFDRQAPGVRRFLGDLLRDEAAADEGTQETFVRAHQRLTTIEDPAKLRGWLFGIARMVSFEHLRRKRRDALPAEPVEEPMQVDQAPSPE